jgi:FG-GAP-like repeat
MTHIKNSGFAKTSFLAALLIFTALASASTVAFEPVQSYAVGDSPIAVATADFNKDGNADLAVLNYVSKDVTILLGKADGRFQSVGTFSAAIPASSLRPSIAVGDFNGDGNMDVAVHLPPNFTAYPGEVHILLGNGDGTLQAPIVTILDFGLAVATVADVNGDKKADLIMNLSDSNNAATGVAVLLGNGDGKFQAPKTVMSGQWRALTVADWNADGKLDLAMAKSSTVQIMLGSGNGTFSPGPTAVLGDGYIASAAWARDLNGDGRVDLIVGSSLTTITGCVDPPCYKTTVRASLLLGASGGSLQGEKVLASAETLDRDVVVGDFDGDGKLDVAMTMVNWPTNSLSVYPGNGDGDVQAVYFFYVRPRNAFRGGRLKRRPACRYRRAGLSQ